MKPTIDRILSKIYSQIDEFDLDYNWNEKKKHDFSKRYGVSLVQFMWVCDFYIYGNVIRFQNEILFAMKYGSFIFVKSF